MKHARFFFFLTLALVLGLTVNARAQGAPYSDPRDNVGSWSWDKPQPKNNEESDEESEDGDEQKFGETSWEKMQAEQAPVEKEPPRQEVLKSLSPGNWLRWWRGENQTEGDDSATEESSSDSEEETLDDSQEPTTEEE
jgi:hypothetical protein